MEHAAEVHVRELPSCPWNRRYCAACLREPPAKRTSICLVTPAMTAVPSVCAPFSHQFVTKKESNCLCKCLRDYYGDTTSQFRSLQQYAAVDNILHARNDVLADNHSKENQTPVFS